MAIFKKRPSPQNPNPQQQNPNPQQQNPNPQQQNPNPQQQNPNPQNPTGSRQGLVPLDIFRRYLLQSEVEELIAKGNGLTLGDLDAAMLLCNERAKDVDTISAAVRARNGFKSPFDV